MNFTLCDVAGLALAVMLFLPVLLLPGYMLGWMGDLLGFRKFQFLFRLMTAVPLSMSLMPILIYWSWRVGSRPGLWCLFGLCWAGAVLLFTGFRSHESPRAWISALKDAPKAAFLIPLLWFAICGLALTDIQIGDRLYFSVITYDHSFRTEVTNSISRTGIPPLNPFYYVHGPSPLRYHYFWFLIGSVVDQLGGAWVTPRNAVAAGAVWEGFGLIALIPLFLRGLGQEGRFCYRRSLIGIGLLAVTGLDLLGTLPLIFHHSTKPEMEWWNEQIAAWIDSMLWVPHNICALVAGMVGFLLIWRASAEERSRVQRVGHTVFAGIAFATCAGTAIYVTVAFAASFCVWGAISLARGSRRTVVALSVSGFIAATLALPYFQQLTVQGTGGTFLTFFVRDFYPLYRFPFSSLTEKFHSAFQLAIIRLLALPLNYFMEFGFYFAVALIQAARLRRKPRLTQADVALLCLFLAPLVLCSFFRSGVIRNNDFGYRGVLLSQFVLLFWGTEVMEEAWSSGGAHSFSAGVRAILLALAGIGLAGTIYGLLINRFYFPMADEGLVEPYYVTDRQIGRRTLALRSLYEELQSRTDPQTIVQANPVHDPGNLFFDDYSLRPTAASGLNCGADFGGSVAACQEVIGGILDIFENVKSGELSNALVICEKAGIQAIVVSDLDPVWKSRASWVWTAKPVVANSFGKAFLVSELASPSTASK